MYYIHLYFTYIKGSALLSITTFTIHLFIRIWLFFMGLSPQDHTLISEG